jgi:phosphohistidine phosphatase SixA
MFLSPDELADLTDRKRQTDQARWLRENGYRFAVSAAGRLKVLRAEVDRHLLGSHRPKVDAGPRLDLIG